MNNYLKDDFIDEVKGCLGKEGDGSGQANVIESIKVNGVDQSVDSNKSVDIPVPTKTSDLDNDSGYVTEDQVNNKVTEGVASIVADAPENFDTLKEMSDWLTQHDESAAAMNTSIKKNADDITALQTSKANQEDVDAVLEDVGEINSNLSDLAYSERSGNKNLLDVSKINEMNSNMVRYGDYGFNNIVTDNRTVSVPFIYLYNGDSLVGGGDDLTKTQSSGIVKVYATFTIPQPINSIKIGHSGSVKNLTVLFNINLPAGTYTISIDIVKDNPSIVGGFEFKNIQIEEGTTATSYEPYIPSVKMLADEVSAQNESLEAQGLDNKFDGILFQGFYDTNVTEGNPVQRDTYVVNKNPINVSDGDIIRVKYSGKEATTIFVQFYKSDGSNNGAMFMENGSNIDSTFVVRANSKTMHINIGNSGGISINDVSSLYVSVNNEITELKNDFVSLEMTTSTIGTPVRQNFPSGFTALNSIIISSMVVVDNDNIQQMDGTNFSAMFYGGQIQVSSIASAFENKTVKIVLKKI